MNAITIQGILFDEKSSYQRGPALAPPLIREALHSGSMNLFSENGLSIESPLILDKGDFSVSSYMDIESITKNHLSENDRIFTLGGDHSISFPILKALHQKYPRIDILHIDAHADLYDSYEGDPHSHACPFARIMENKLAQRLVQLGIRTLNPHQAEQAKKLNVEIHTMKDWHIEKLPSFQTVSYTHLTLPTILRV